MITHLNVELIRLKNTKKGSSKHLRFWYLNSYSRLYNYLSRAMTLQIVPSDEDKITLGSTFPGDVEIINVDSGEKTPIGSCFADSPYTLFVLMRHFV